MYEFLVNIMKILGRIWRQLGLQSYTVAMTKGVLENITATSKLVQTTH
jgi:hypothetical protein